MPKTVNTAREKQALLTEYPLLEAETLPLLHPPNLSGPISDNLLLWGSHGGNRIIGGADAGVFGLACCP